MCVLLPSWSVAEAPTSRDSHPSGMVWSPHPSRSTEPISGGQEPEQTAVPRDPVVPNLRYGDAFDTVM